jgi:hypothetical protein
VALQVAQAYTEEEESEVEDNSNDKSEQAGEQDFIDMVVAAVGGDEAVTETVNEIIEQMVDNAEMRKLSMALTKLLAGERDSGKLTKRLDQQEQTTIAKILAALA